jgi:hypothetical protein
MCGYWPPSANWKQRADGASGPFPSNFTSPNLQPAVALLSDILHGKSLPIARNQNGAPQHYLF